MLSRALVVASLLLFTGCSQEEGEAEATRPVKAMQVNSPDLIRSRPFPGVIRAEDRVNLSFRVSGPLIELSVDVGDRVEEGTVLARIDPRDFEINLKEAKGKLERSIAAKDFAESDFTRAERIQKRDPGAISQSMVEKKREERNSLRAEVRSLRAQVASSKDQLNYTYLRAPYAGVIVAKFVDNFQFVRAEQPVVRMVDTSTVEMVVDIPEHLISYIPNVKEIVVKIDVLPEREFPATVKEIGAEANATTRTFPVTLLMNQPPDVELFAGMSGEAKFIGKIESDKEPTAITIPSQSLFTDENGTKSFVWVIDEESNQAIKREVVVDRITNSGVRLRSGLKSGEWIATAGVYHLKEGQKVRILKSDQ